MSGRGPTVNAGSVTGSWGRAPSLSFVGVTVRSPQGSELMHRVALEVRSGDHVAILGSAGTGKSALLRAAIGLYVPFEGYVEVNGSRLDQLDHAALRDHRARTGYVTDEQGLLVNQTLFENVALPLRYHRGVDEAEVRTRVFELFDELGIGPYGMQRPATCNRAVRKRARVARALILAPTLFLMEEPDAGLVPREQKLIWDAVAKRRDRYGLTLLVTGHEGDVGLLCRDARHVRVEEGRLVEGDTGGA